MCHEGRDTGGAAQDAGEVNPELREGVLWQRGDHVTVVVVVRPGTTVIRRAGVVEATDTVGSVAPLARDLSAADLDVL